MEEKFCRFELTKPIDNGQMKKKKNKYGLTEKEHCFCQEYLIDFNATAAALRAGYTGTGIRQKACQLLTKVNIANALQQMKAARSRRTGITQDRVLQELARIAFVCITDVVDIKNEDIKLKSEPSKEDDYMAYLEWKDNVSSLAEFNQVTTYKEDETTVATKVKLHDKMKALTLLMKHLGMLNDFDMAIACLREKYGLSLSRDDDGQWQVVDLSRIQS